MRKISFLVLLGIIAFSLESCSLMSNSNDKSVDNQSVQTVVEEGKRDGKQANKNTKSVKKEPSAPKAEEFEEAKREKNVAGLIPATKPEVLAPGPIGDPVEIPRAELAENVLITGLIELGDHIKVIVQAPEETSARYVEIGQYLSNGQVLVKRIEPGFPAPTVILEQDGVEVAKVIGEDEEEEETL